MCGDYANIPNRGFPAPRRLIDGCCKVFKPSCASRKSVPPGGLPQFSALRGALRPAVEDLFLRAIGGEVPSRNQKENVYD